MKINKLFLFTLIFFLAISLVSASRLPTVDGDSDTWGTVLNDYLSRLAGANATELNQTMVNGTNIYSNSINTTHLVDGTITADDIGTGAVGDDEIDYTAVTLADFINDANYLDKDEGGIINGELTINGNLSIIGSYINATVTNQYLNGSFFPDLTNIFDIGSSILRWNNIFTNTLYTSSIFSNDWTNVSITESQVSDADWWDEDGDINDDEISEGKIGFSTSCGTGNHLYVNGNDLACEPDTSVNGTNINVLDVNASSATIHGDLNVTGNSYLGSINLEGGNVTATNGEFGTLNVTGSAYIGQLTWNGNLDLGNNNITNINKISVSDWSNLTDEYNESWSSTYNSTYNTWAYNQTIPANVYSDNINTTLSSRIDNINEGNESFNQTLTDSIYIAQSEEANLNVNSSTWWASVSGWVSGWFVNNAGNLEFNETKLNNTIDSRDSDTTYSHLTNFTDDLGNRGYTSLSNFTNDKDFINSTQASAYNETNYIDGIVSDNNASWSSTYNATYDAKVSDNSSWNESYAKTIPELITTYNATYDAKVSDNSSWNQSHADTLYSGIEWDYNQTIPANTYTDSIVNSNNASWVSTYNSTYDAKADYEFGANNFNGSGNLTTTGAINASNMAFQKVGNLTSQMNPSYNEDFVFGSPQLADDGNASHDKRMFFDKSKGAFRVGYEDGDRWDDANVGTNSFGFGRVGH